MSDSADQLRCHLDQRSREDVRYDERPSSGSRCGSTVDQLQSVAEPIDACVFGGHIQRSEIDVDASGSRHAEHERCECQYTRSGANIEQRVR
jgi:hypothetical protein